MSFSKMANLSISNESLEFQKNRFREYYETNEGLICKKCYRIILRSQTVAYYFVFGIGIFLVFFGIMGIYSDYKSGLINVTNDYSWHGLLQCPSH